ncbi:DUF1858 domain-containing protein [Clostridium sp. Marseille-P299]|uniref:DUF1858 domain-containing protein n=1 Tax=Clostridium sp. Marseille-P299 TaxID=1805477 RepID=UPI000A8E7023
MVDKSMKIGEILGLHEEIPPLLLQSGMHCLGCPSSQMESLEEACMVHGINVDELVEKINSLLK